MPTPKTYQCLDLKPKTVIITQCSHKNTPEHLHCLHLVLALAALILTRHHNAAGDVNDAHRAVCGVDVLTALATRPIGFDAQVCLVDCHGHLWD